MTMKTADEILREIMGILDSPAEDWAWDACCKIIDTALRERVAELERELAARENVIVAADARIADLEAALREIRDHEHSAEPERMGYDGTESAVWHVANAALRGAAGIGVVVKPGRRLGGADHPQTCGSAGSSPAAPTTSRKREIRRQMRKLDRKIGAAEYNLYLFRNIDARYGSRMETLRKLDARRRALRLELKRYKPLTKIPHSADQDTTGS